VTLCTGQNIFVPRRLRENLYIDIMVV